MHIPTTILSSRLNEKSPIRQPQALAPREAEASLIPPNLVSQLGLIGGIEVLRELKRTLFLLRSHHSQYLPIPSYVILRTDTAETAEGSGREKGPRLRGATGSCGQQKSSASDWEIYYYCQRASRLRNKCNEIYFKVPSYHRELFAKAINDSARTITVAEVEDLPSLIESILS